MPLDSMFPTGPTPLDGVRLSVTEVIAPDGLAWQANVERRHRQGEWGTIHVGRYHGVMTDCLPGWAESMVGTFLYGPGGEELYRDARSTLKVARAHLETWEASGGRVEY